MKVRMHEKAKKKTAEKYTVQQLLEKVYTNDISLAKTRTISGMFLYCSVLNYFHQLPGSYVTFCCVDRGMHRHL